MAQGAGKIKPNPLKKEKNRHKKQQPKKGARVIAPKKTKHLEAAKLKKGLEKAIKSNIEQEITMKAKSVEGKSFNVLQAPSTSEGKSKISSDSVKKN